MDDWDVDSPPPIEVLDITGSLDAPSEDGNVDDQLFEDENSSEWYSLSLHEKWKDVVKRLIDKEMRWDDDEQHDHEWKPGVRVLDPRERESLAAFNDRNTVCPTVLHRLADNFNNDDFNKLPPMTQVKIVAYLLGEHRKARAQATADYPEEPVLTRAFTNRNNDFIRFVMKHFSKDHLPDLVDDKDSNGSNCLHYFFKRHLPEAVDDVIKVSRRSGRKLPRSQDAITSEITNTLHQLDALIRVAKPQCVVATDSDGNTPMHYAMAYRVCRLPTPTYKKLALQLIEIGNKSKDVRSRQFNNAQESPYLYFERTRRDFITQNLRPRTNQKPTQAMGASSIAKRSERGNMSKPREHETGAAQRNVARAENGSSMIHAMMKKPTGDSQESAKPSAAPRTLPAALQHTNENKRDIEALRAAAADKFSMTSLARRDTAGLIKNESEDANLPRASSPALGPTSKPVKTRAEHTKEDIGKKNLEEPKEDYPSCINSAEDVRQQLKLHYIRNKPELEAKELLYGRIASDKNLSFDATNSKRKTSKELADLVNLLANPGNFDDTLSYVSLPVLSDSAENSNSNPSATSASYDANERRQRVTSSHDNKPMGRNSAVAVFDKLAEFGVRKIIRLIVEEDPNLPPHTDVAIERAIRGWDSLDPDNKRKYPEIAVEIWDWRKFDLSTDVIGFASPKVSEVNLYWRGNQTVLKGWASEDGIPRLFSDSGKTLKAVNIHWSPGFETEKRCGSLLADLKRQVEKRISKLVDKNKRGVKIETKRLVASKTTDGGGLSHLGGLMPGNLNAPPDHGWIESMKTFRQALMTIHEDLPSGRVPERVKVALIDDGVDRANLNAYRNQAEVRGMSYWTSFMGTSLQNPSWYQSTHGHGTIMANSIIRLNPWVSLYAMRIQDESNIGSRNEVNVYIHPGSAARAIEDAIILKVDIISISWTIHNMATSNTKPPGGRNGDAIEALKTAINRAREHGILIFCSASDDIKKKGADTLPYTQAKDYIFRIGAADAYGWSDKLTEDHRTIDYFLPGNQVADDVNPRLNLAEELKYRDGSSIATAFAAGLASLLLYLVNLVKIRHTDHTSNAQRLKKYGDLLRTRDGLKKAFENIITDENYRDKKFLPVWDLFGSRAKEILDKNKDMGSKWDLLDELCTKLAA